MSLYDVSKLTGASPVRGVGRDFSGTKAEAKEARSPAAADKGVAVQTGSRVEAGSVPVGEDQVAHVELTREVAWWVKV